MAPVSKRRKSRPRAKRTAGTATARLDVQRDPVRKQEIHRRSASATSRARGDDLVPGFFGDEFIQLMNRRAQALVELPLRIAMSRTPFEAWRHQNQFMQGVVDDWEFATLRLMHVVFAPLPKLLA
jgi:hypothetical protein